ncbi:hypothetical protein MMPV_005127 [Pyropia vietnamensis]
MTQRRWRPGRGVGGDWSAVATTAAVVAVAAAVSRQITPAAAVTAEATVRLAALVPSTYRASNLLTTLVSAMRLAQRDVNRSPDILPGHMLALDLLPMAEAPTSLQGLVTLCRTFQGPLSGNNGDGDGGGGGGGDDDDDDDGAAPAAATRAPPIHGIVGPFTSAVASGLAPVVSAFLYNVPTLSPTALIAYTDAADLDAAAPAAATSVRRLLLILPGGAEAHAQALLATVRAMKHQREEVRFRDSRTAALLVKADAAMPERVGILYSTDVYGQGGLRALLSAIHDSQERATASGKDSGGGTIDRSASVEVVAALPLNVNEPGATLSQFAALSPRVIIVWSLLLNGRASRLFQEAAKVGLVSDQHQWILSDGGSENDIWDVPLEAASPSPSERVPGAEGHGGADAEGKDAGGASGDTDDDNGDDLRALLSGFDVDNDADLLPDEVVTVERDAETAISAVGALAIRQASVASSPTALAFERRWRRLNSTIYPGAGTDMLRSQELNEYVLFAYDAVVAMARALDTVIRARGGVAPDGFSLSKREKADGESQVAPGTECVWGSPWEAGDEVAAALAALDFKGASGRISFGATDGIRPKDQGGFKVLNLQTRGGDAVWVPIANGSYTDEPPSNALDHGFTQVPDGRIDYYDDTSGVWLQSLPAAYQQFPGVAGGTPQYPYDRASLRGRRDPLRVIVKPLSPFVQMDERRSGNERFFGIAVDVLQQIAQELSFSVEFFAASEGMGTSEVLTSLVPGSRIPVQTFGGAGGVAARQGDSSSGGDVAATPGAMPAGPQSDDGNSNNPNSASSTQFDMAIGAVSITSARAANLSFTTPYWQSALQVMVRHVSVWALVLAATLAYGLLMLVFEGSAVVGNADFRGRSQLSSAALSLWHSAMVGVGGRQFVAAKTPEGRLITVAFVTGVLVVAMAYTAELGAFLSTASAASVVLDSVEDIRSGVLPLNRIAVLSGGATEEWVMREINGGGFGGGRALALAPGGKAYLTCRTPDECEELLSVFKADAWLSDGPLLVYRTGTTSCDMSVIPVKLSSEGFGFALPSSTHVSVLRELNTAIVQLSERGLLSKLEATYFVEECLGEGDGGIVDTETIDSHTVTELSGLFILLGVFMAGAVMIRCLRLYW